MENVTPGQLKCLNTLVSKLGISKEDKEAMVNGFSGSRVSSSKDLSKEEATKMIRHLKDYEPDERLRKKVFACAYEAGIIYGSTSEDKKMNIAKLNMFLLKNGTVKKHLNKMDHKELTKTISQLEQIKKNIKQTDANRATKSLLEELNLTVTKTRQQSH